MSISKLMAILGVGFLFCHLQVSASQHTTKYSSPPSNPGKIVEDPDIPAVFTGGTAEMHKFISNTLKYPAEAAEKNKQGLVVHTFIVEEDGTLTNFKLIHRADSLLDAEALRILKAMPPWRPAKLNGQIVRTESYLPLYFRLNKNARPSSRRVISADKVVKPDATVYENDEIYAIVDKMPQYPGGEEKLAQFLSSNIHYPQKARREGIQGRILCSFVIGKDGKVSNIEVVDGKDSALNDEAVRVLSLMPQWEAGENDGEKVNVKCLLPIDFTIDEATIN